MNDAMSLNVNMNEGIIRDNFQTKSEYHAAPRFLV